MNKFVSIVLLVFAYLYTLADSDKDFEFYKSIPKYESISLSGQDVSIVIKKYSVTLSGTDNSGDYERSVNGAGLISWDPNDKCMYLTVTGTVRGSYSMDERVYRTEKKYNVGSTTLKVLFGDDAADSYRYEKVYDHTNYYRASGSEKFSIKVPLHISSDGKYYSIQERTLSATLTGNCTRTINFYLRSGEKRINYGTEKSIASSTDEFGAWQWNQDRTQIWINSTNISDASLIIWINKDSEKKFTMALYNGGKKLDGKSSSASEDGKKLIQFSVSFEDGTNVTLPFVERLQENGAYVYDYSTYNRFLNEWNNNATSIVGQIKDKQTMVFTYKSSDNSSYSAIFELEGLENIISYY